LIALLELSVFAALRSIVDVLHLRCIFGRENDAMSETIITVQGSASAWHDAERATVSLQVVHDGPERAPVVEATSRVAADVTAALAALENGAVTRWSSDRVSVSSSRPWNNEGKQLPPVYRAAVFAT